MTNEIDINKNYATMNKTIMSDKKSYQLISILLAFVIGGVIMVWLRPVIGTTLCSYIALVVVMPLGFLGVYELHGMDLITYINVKKQIREHGKLFYDLNPLAGVADNHTEKLRPVILSGMDMKQRILKAKGGTKK